MSPEQKFLMISLQYYCILGLAEKKLCIPETNYAQKMQDVQVTKSLSMQIKNPLVTPAINHTFLSIIFSADLRVLGSARALQTTFSGHRNGHCAES